jgi:iron complex outermembrane receptor protein
MPADRFQYGFRWGHKQGYLRLSANTVQRQIRIPEAGLLKAAPNGFTVLNFDAAHTFLIFRDKKRLEIGLTLQNLVNTRYREYLNFFRYYADETGLNLGLRAKLTF